MLLASARRDGQAALVEYNIALATWEYAVGASTLPADEPQPVIQAASERHAAEFGTD
jgi:hypothetical protein